MLKFVLLRLLFLVDLLSRGLHPSYPAGMTCFKRRIQLEIDVLLGVKLNWKRWYIDPAYIMSVPLSQLKKATIIAYLYGPFRDITV